MYLIREKERFFLLGFLLLFLGGCAPVGAPPPPGFFLMGFNWLVIGLIIVGAFLLWHYLSSTKERGSAHITDAINAINSRLNILEKKIEEIEKKL